MAHIKFCKTPLPSKARAVASRLKCYAFGYCSESKDFVDGDRRLWWSVLEESLVDLTYLGSPLERSVHAPGALEWFRSDACEGVLAALGLEPDYVRMIVKRFMHHTGIKEGAL